MNVKFKVPAEPEFENIAAAVGDETGQVVGRCTSDGIERLDVVFPLYGGKVQGLPASAYDVVE